MRLFSVCVRRRAGLDYKKSPAKDNKRENAELTWTFEATKELNNQRLTCRAENPALKQPLFTSISVQVQCEYFPTSKRTRNRSYRDGISGAVEPSLLYILRGGLRNGRRIRPGMIWNFECRDQPERDEASGGTMCCVGRRNAGNTSRICLAERQTDLPHESTLWHGHVASIVRFAGPGRTQTNTHPQKHRRTRQHEISDCEISGGEPMQQKIRVDIEQAPKYLFPFLRPLGMKAKPSVQLSGFFVFARKHRTANSLSNTEATTRIPSTPPVIALCISLFHSPLLPVSPQPILIPLLCPTST